MRPSPQKSRTAVNGKTSPPTKVVQPKTVRDASKKKSEPEKRNVPNGPWTEHTRYMAGTELTGEYVVFAVSGIARVGVRRLPDEVIRIRVEPYPDVSRAHLSHLYATLNVRDGWNQPDDTRNRWSKTTDFTNSVPSILSALQSLMQQQVSFGATMKAHEDAKKPSKNGSKVLTQSRPSAPTTRKARPKRTTVTPKPLARASTTAVRAVVPTPEHGSKRQKSARS